MQDEATQRGGAAVDGTTPLVLASGSRYRAEMLAEAGIPVVVDPPRVDERAFDGRLHTVGPDALAVELAVLKADDVAPRHPGRVVIAADQVGVLRSRSGALRLLTKQPSTAGAVAQLMDMSGTVHHLVNGVVVRTPSGAVHTGVDVQEVTMRDYSEAEALAYVERFEPFDTSGSYRLEDGDAMVGELGDGAALVASVVGEHPSGVLGLPLPLLGRLLADAGMPLG